MVCKRMGLNWLFILLTLTLLFYLTTCQSLPVDPRRAWIDLPFQNAEFPAGSVIPLLAHVYAQSGVAEVQCAIDGIPYHRGAPDQLGSSFSTYEQQVIINDLGIHTISVVAYNAQGEASNPAFVSVTITESEEILPSPTTATATPAVQETTPPEPVSISFWADQTQIQQGNCTNLHWNVQHADTVSLDSGSISASGSKQICPSQNTTYTLSASGLSGGKQASVTVSVASPPPTDSDPPQISKISHTPGKIWNYSTCGAISFTVSAKVSDASAISRVTILFRVVKNGQTGSWVERTMSGSSGNYQVSIGPNDLKQSLDSYRGRAEYYITAEDEHGNSSQSGTGQIEIGECLL